MTKDEILFWRNKYDKEEDLLVKGFEEELGRKFRKISLLPSQTFKKSSNGSSKEDC